MPKNTFETLGLINRLNRNMMGIFGDWITEYGEIVRGVVGVHLVNPDHIHEVLVTQSAKFNKDSGYTDPVNGLARFTGNGLLTSNGDFWKRQRRLAAPAFHHKRIMSYGKIMADHTETMLKTWKGRRQIDLRREMNRLTMNIVTKTLFNTDLDRDADRIYNAIEAMQNASSGFNIIPRWVPTPGELRGRAAKREFDRVTNYMIDLRRKSGEDQGDLLTMLMMARDEDGTAMTDQQLRDEAVTIFLAGQETTANAMGWAFYLLSQHPEVEAKLHAEVDRVLAGRAPTLEDLKQLPYTEMVVKEVLRLYPPAWLISREANDEVQIGEYTFPAGTLFGVMIYHLHRSPQWWDQPDAFIPERFSPENEHKINKRAYIPFSNGPRICIGNTFAQMEAQIILAQVASQYRLAVEPGYKVEMMPRLTLSVKNRLPMILTPR
jgi:cytochrome P450